MKFSTQMWLWRGAVGALALGLMGTTAELATVGRAPTGSLSSPIVQSDPMNAGGVIVWKMAADGKSWGAHEEPAPWVRAPAIDPRVCSSEWMLQRALADDQKSVDANDRRLWGRLQPTTLAAKAQIAEGTNLITEVCGPDKGEP